MNLINFLFSSSIYPIIQRVPVSETENSNGKTTFNIEAIATVARASSVGPSGPSGPSSSSSGDTVSQMVETDMRTPPKLKEIFKEKNSDKKENDDDVKSMPVTFIYDDDGTMTSTEKFSFTDAFEGKSSNTKKVQMSTEIKGIAIPVVMDDDIVTNPPNKILQKIPEVVVVKPAGKDEKKKNTITKSYLTTTPSSGLSTWILLSDNREMTTLSPKKSSKKDNNNSSSNDDGKKKTTGNVSTTKKPVKNSSTTPKVTTTKKTTVKTSSTKKTTENETNSTSALEALVKIQKKNGISSQSTATTTTNTPTTVKQKTTEIKNGPQKKITTDSKKKGGTEKKDGVENLKKQSETAQTLPAHFFLSTEDFTGLSVTEENNNPSSTTETSVESTTTKKKKSTMKKKKKNKKKKKQQPETRIESKVPPTPAVGSQIYNFLSREIVPTVGLGLIGVALTAGLASFLGYNPFVSSTVPLRRTYETSHGYSPSNYYSYSGDYNDGGQSEESLLREVLSGMPEESRYGITHGDSTYSDSYNRKNAGYETIKTPNYSEQSGGSSYNSDKGTGNYDANYPQEYSYSSNYDTTDTKYNSEFNEKYPVYTRETGTSFVYPETTGMVSGEKSSSTNYNANKNSQYGKLNSDTIEKQPEALYRVGNDQSKETSSQNNWHRIGTPMEPLKQYSRLEPGPRSLDLTKNSKESESKNRRKRNVGDNIQRIARKRTKMENDEDNEIDSIVDHKISEQSSEEIISPLTNFELLTTNTSPKTETSTPAMTEVKIRTTTSPTTTTMTTTTTTEDTTEPYFEDDGNIGSTSSPTNSVLELLRRLAQFKLKLGLNFLKSTTDMFSRYLDVIQKKVDESFTNTTTVQYNRKKNPWSRIFFGEENDNLKREKRSALKDDPLLTSLLTEEEEQQEQVEEVEGKQTNDKYSKSTKKELKLSNKIFHSKKNLPKKYHESKNRKLNDKTEINGL